MSAGHDVFLSHIRRVLVANGGNRFGFDLEQATLEILTLGEVRPLVDSDAQTIGYAWEMVAHKGHKSVRVNLDEMAISNLTGRSFC